MPETTYRGRRAVSIEDGTLRVTVLREGGHIAEIFHTPTGINPLWTPPWPSIEPSTYERAKHPEYGDDSESKLLAGIMGHNLCLDIFGPPSKEEAAAGLTVHGEASVVPWDISSRGRELTMRARLPIAQLAVERSIRLNGRIEIAETVENLSSADRPVAWTQHVTLGPPFLERGRTQFRASASKGRVLERDFGPGGYMKSAADFDWPNVPLATGGTADLRVYNSAQVSSGFTTQLMDPHREQAFFVAWSPESRLAFGYVWRRADFPWLGIWEENHSRTQPPWNGKTMTRGMEFGASPMPETRREMIERNGLYGMPGYRWIPARTKIRVEYHAVARQENAIPEELS